MADLATRTAPVPAEPASFHEQRRDAVRSRTGSSSAVVISEAERVAVTTGMDHDDTGSMSMETVQVALDSSPSSRQRPSAIPDTLSGLTRNPRSRGGDRPRGGRVSAGTTSSHPRPGKLRGRKKKRGKGGPPDWLWGVALAALIASGTFYWWTQTQGGALP